MLIELLLEFGFQIFEQLQTIEALDFVRVLHRVRLEEVLVSAAREDSLRRCRFLREVILVFFREPLHSIRYI